MDKSVYVCQLERKVQQSIESELRRVLISSNDIKDVDITIHKLMNSRIEELEKYINLEAFIG